MSLVSDYRSKCCGPSRIQMFYRLRIDIDQKVICKVNFELY